MGFHFGGEMAIPDIFGKRRPVSPPGGRGKFSADLLDEAISTELMLSIPKQEKSLWCWVAVGSGIASFYRVNVPTQCRVANAVLNVPDDTCCRNGDSSCNRFGYLNHTLAHFNCFDRYEAGVPRPSAIDTEIGGRRPLGVRVQWQTGIGAGTGHFLAVSGIRQTATGTDLVVKDPWEGSTSVVSHAKMASSYGVGKGRWTHSFFTISPSDAELAGGGDAFKALDDDPGLLGGM